MSNVPPSPPSGPPAPGTIPPGDVAGLRAAWAINPQDIGLGLYHPSTGEVRLGSFDTTGGQGHQGLADVVGITANQEWRGFIVSSAGQLIPTSHFNLVDGGKLAMRPDLAAVVEHALRQAGLVR